MDIQASSQPNLHLEDVVPKNFLCCGSTDKKMSTLSNIIIGAWAIIATAAGFLTMNPLVAVTVFGVGSVVTLGGMYLIQKIYEKITDTCFPTH